MMVTGEHLIMAGVIELENGNRNQAAGYLNAANTLSPNNAIVLNNLGALEAGKGNVDVAAALFKQAQSLGSNENYNIGIPLIGKAKYNDAIIAFDGKKCSHNLGLAQLLPVTQLLLSQRLNAPLLPQTLTISLLLPVPVPTIRHYYMII